MVKLNKYMEYILLIFFPRLLGMMVQALVTFFLFVFLWIGFVIGKGELDYIWLLFLFNTKESKE